MVISEEAIKKFANDPEAQLFLRMFDEPKGSRILEVGAHDAPLSTTLAGAGYDMTSIDLRPYDGPKPEMGKHVHIVGDFLNHPISLHGAFDCVFAVSALEHFGLGTYGEAVGTPFDDVLAARRMYDFLHLGGTCYMTVPFGGRFIVREPHWRVYDLAAVLDRLVQKFTIQNVRICVVEDFAMGDRVYHVGEDLLTTNRLFDALCITEGFPGVSIALKLRKDK